LRLLQAATRCELSRSILRLRETPMGHGAGVRRIYKALFGSRAKMKTLYDLLEALPDDDAEGLRTAFRRAVKGAHPDIRPGDPDAALRFGQIVRANEILGDAEQRAAYDHLLELARLEPEWGSEHTIAGRIHKLASGVIAMAGGSVVTVAGYLLFLHMSAASVAQANYLDVTIRPSPQIAAISPAGSPDKAGAASDPAASEVRSLRAPGILAYRKSDLNGAMADLNKAVKFDPRSLATAYIDHRTIFYRLRKFERAVAAVAGAKRIEKASRTISAPTMARKPLVERIIAVESSGDPNAKNKRSSATGAGQFLDETWLEMIGTYRPDLVPGRSQKEILELRRDPELAREIVTRLVEQNAAMLKKRALPVTPGTLYLAHFAGPAGAVAVLSVSENADAAALMASADASGRTTREKLVNANPFLKELTVGDLKNWANQKMSSY
jgi:curved DNA-binding protein CbpA